MTKREGRKVRKPKDYPLGMCIHISTEYPDTVLIDGARYIGSKDCRKLAAWLIRAAEYLESK